MFVHETLGSTAITTHKRACHVGFFFCNLYGLFMTFHSMTGNRTGEAMDTPMQRSVLGYSALGPPYSVCTLLMTTKTFQGSVLEHQCVQTPKAGGGP